MFRKPVLLVGLGLAILVITLIRGSAASADTSPNPKDINSSCNTCHSQSLTMKFLSGETLSLQVNPEAFAASVHGRLRCDVCHQVSGFPHPPTNAKTLRDYEIVQKNVCLECHSDAYNQMNESVHQAFADNLLCSDCHGTHYMTRPVVMNREIAVACYQCHSAVGKTYQQSIHGSGAADAADVPACTDCHGAHVFEMRPTRTEAVELCIKCHSNTDLMDKYGISTNVVGTYLQDYHGKTVTLLSKQAAPSGVDEAICSDCHSVHDIQKTDNAGIQVIQNKMGDTCANCHEGANANFASAWLSHNDPGVQHAPLVFLVNIFYKIMIPVMVAGLLIHIAFDIRRSRRQKGGEHAIR